MRTDLHDEHVADGQLRANSEQRGGDAERVGVRQFRQIAGTHQDIGGGETSPQVRVTAERTRKSKMDRIENWIEYRRNPAFVGSVRRSQ